MIALIRGAVGFLNKSVAFGYDAANGHNHSKIHNQFYFQFRSHSKEKPCECPECGKCFATTSILKSHREIHKEEKTYACTLCDMTFKKRKLVSVREV